jgi:hypothetical protein
MIAELRGEVQKVLDAGPLAPLRTVYADLVQDEYFLYWQPGRIITTLARSYPYLTPAQQQAVRRYVRSELDDPERAPWASQGHLPAEGGARREIHSFHQSYGWDRYWQMCGRRKPAMGAFYGLWLYADRTGDWDALKRHYSEIASLYSRKTGQCDLYGTMSAHLAMARIARHFADPKVLAQAVENARAAFQAGTSFAAVEQRTRSYWPERYVKRQEGLVYQGWMFLDLAPEIGRYLVDHVKAPVLERNRCGHEMYPLFWLREVPYASRWTGDEGLGIPTELMGMLVPVDRWVAGASPETLAGYTRSTPLCLGDSYWLEMLVDAIESTGATRWVELS